MAVEPLDVEVEPGRGRPARVVAVADDHRIAYVELATGQVVSFSSEARLGLSVGDVGLLGESSWSPAPVELWHAESKVGIVRQLIGQDELLLETDLGLRVITRNTDPVVVAGNTVEYTDSGGVVRVIADRPVRIRDSADDSESVDRYRVDSEIGGPTFANFGGYPDVVRRARALIETQVSHKAELQAIGARPIKGVLFTGPPGTGKTLLAQIIARESGAAFFLVSGPSIVSKWVGDSEELLRRIFEEAAGCESAVIFFDEIDSVASQRGDDSNESSKRLVAQLLTLMDGFDVTSNVIVIAATNRVQDIDVALLRPGRFDWEITFGMPTLSDRLEILASWKGRVATTGDLPLEEIAVASNGWSAAQLTSLWTEAALIAASDTRSAISEEDLAEAFELVRDRPDKSRTGTSGDS